MVREADKSFKNIKQINKDLRKLRVKKIILHKELSPKKLLGQNGFIMLHRLLARSRTLLYSIINSFERKDLLTLALSTRAHLETTGLLTYMMKQFKRYYENEISLEEMDEKLKRIFLGSTEKDIGSTSDPIHVMKAIECIDQETKALFANEKDFFRGQYDILSQYCHPNQAGTTSHNEINERTGEIIFLNDEDAFLEWPIALAELSAGFFNRHWNEFHSLISKNEELPKSE